MNNKRPRTIHLTISDDGDTRFGFTMTGDAERIGEIPPTEYSAAEYWAVQLFAVCTKELQNARGEVRPINRAERRKGET